MKLLAIDASAPMGSAAIVLDGRTSQSCEFGGGRSRGGGAAAAIEKLAGTVGMNGVDGVVVGTGPGSYTGLRSSIAAAWGFALGRGIPLCGISSLLALAPGEYFAVGDARRGQFYLAHVDRGRFISEPALFDHEQLQSILAANPHLPRLVPSPAGLPAEQVASPRPELLAVLADFDKSSTTTLCQPIYLKPPHITQPGGKAPIL